MSEHVRPPREQRPLMAYGRFPVTPEAVELCAQIAREIEQTERRERARRGHDQRRFVDTVGRFVADLAITAATPGMFRGFLRGKRFFLQDTVPVSRPNTMAVYAGLQALSYIVTVAPSFCQRSGDWVIGGEAETIGVTGKLRDRLAAAGVLENPTVHFETDRETYAPSSWAPVILKEIAMVGHRKAKTVSKAATTTPLYAKLTAAMEQRNAFIRDRQPVGAQPLEGWQRVFENTFNRAGRVYAQPYEGSYQMLDKASRIQLHLVGQRCAEIDLRASFLHIALAWRGVSLAERCAKLDIEDPYALGTLPREVVKEFVSASFGQGRWIARWPRGSISKFGRRPPGVEVVRDAVLSAYPELAELQSRRPAIEWGSLQYRESEIVLAVMDKLRLRGIPALPVHDSLIVPRTSVDLALLFIEQEVQEQTGCPPLRPRVNDVEDYSVAAAPMREQPSLEELDEAA